MFSPNLLRLTGVMSQARTKHANRTHLPHLLSNVPEDYQEPVNKMCLKMMSHDAYGRP